MRISVVAIALVSFLTVSTPTANAQVESACGSPLAAADVARVIELSDTASLAGSTMDQLESAVDRHHQIVDVLVSHRDRRGLFAIGLDAVEQEAVMPLQRNSRAFDNPEYAHSISLDLLRRFLVALHAEFTGALQSPHWQRYFALTHACGSSGVRTAMAGYNAHLLIDLPYSVAAVGSTIANQRDYFTIVNMIGGKSRPVIDNTRAAYGVDIGPLWRGYFIGDGVHALAGPAAVDEMVRLADVSANIEIFTVGLGLRDPVLGGGAAATAQAGWTVSDTVVSVL